MQSLNSTHFSFGSLNNLIPESFVVALSVRLSLIFAATPHPKGIASDCQHLNLR